MLEEEGVMLDPEESKQISHMQNELDIAYDSKNKPETVVCEYHGEAKKKKAQKKSKSKKPQNAQINPYLTEGSQAPVQHGLFISSKRV